MDTQQNYRSIRIEIPSLFIVWIKSQNNCFLVVKGSGRAYKYNLISLQPLIQTEITPIAFKNVDYTLPLFV